MINYLNNILKQYFLLDYKIIKTTEKKIIFKNMFDVQNSEIYTGTNIFIILYTENNIIKLNIADKDSIYNILNFYDIKQRDYKISVKPLEPIILYSPAITKYNKFNYDNCSNWFKIQIDDIIKNNPLSFNSIMTCSLYEQEFCDDKVYYKQYSENSNFIFAENTNFKLIFKVSGCMFDEKLSERVSLLILENNKRIFEISYIYDAKLKSTIRLYEIEAIKTTKVNVIKHILNRRFNCKNHLIQKGGYYNEIK